MAKVIERIALPGSASGTAHELVVHRYGSPGARPKAYLQASIHADETPPMLVLHHLLRFLDEAARDGTIRGEIVVVPVANPIGLSQEVMGMHIGRSDLAGGGNFNRQWPDVTDRVAAAIAGALGPEAGANAALIRHALAQAVAAIEPANSLAAMRLSLLARAIDADIVLDLHSDQEALPHLFIGTPNWPAGSDLAAELQSRAALFTHDPGGQAFEDICALAWHKLGARFGPTHPVPQACLAATIELRGKADVSDALAARDAQGLFRFLTRRGVLAGDPGPLPDSPCEAVPFEAVDVVRAPRAGVLVHRASLGDQLTAGDVLADIVDPTAEDPRGARTSVATRATGWVLARRADRYVRLGQVVAKVVGRTPLPDRTGHLLED